MKVSVNYCFKCGKQLQARIIDNKHRLCCTDEVCGFIYWNNPIPVVGIIVETLEGIVLAHNRLSPKGIFSVITGFLEADETPQRAAVREVKEELGLDASTVEFLGIFSFARANQIFIAYHIVATGTLRLNEELDEVKIVQRGDLLGYRETSTFDVEQWLSELRVLA